MLQQIEAALEAGIRPRLAVHGGGVDLLRVENGIAHLRLFGPCSSCLASCINAEQDYLDELREYVPELRGVVVEREVSQWLLEEAKRRLGERHEG